MAWGQPETDRFGAGIGCHICRYQRALVAQCRTIYPSNLAPVTTTGSQSEAGLVAEESLDFIDRPLFWSSRRPPVAAITEEVAVVAQVSDEAKAEKLEGIQLLGTFGSGDQSGVIVAAKDDERDRLYVGDTLSGWTLTEVASRAAFFELSLIHI